MPRLRHLHRHRHGLPLAWLLAALLLLAQGLGLAHRVAHGGGTATVAQQAGWSADHEAGGAACQIVDQLAHADALCGDAAATAPACAATHARPQPRPCTAAARTAAAYLARGPPRA